MPWTNFIDQWYTNDTYPSYEIACQLSGDNLTPHPRSAWYMCMRISLALLTSKPLVQAWTNTTQLSPQQQAPPTLITWCVRKVKVMKQFVIWMIMDFLLSSFFDTLIFNLAVQNV